MGGFVLDIVVAFLLLRFLRLVRFFRSMRWMRVTVPISRTEVLNPFWGCPSVQVHYRRGPNKYQEGCDEVPFLVRRTPGITRRKSSPIKR